MSYICSVGTSLPQHNLTQTEIKQLVNEIFPRPEEEKQRLLSVFDHANIENRQFVVPPSWFTKNHSFEDRNKLYQQQAITHALCAIDNCLTDNQFLAEPIPFEAVDAIIFVSSTGISTPSIDAHLINRRNFRQNIVRMPLWGLGCAGGTSGLARAYEYLQYNRKGVVLVICVELCSLTFQKDDARKSNFIGTALFGDGISAALLIGDESNLLNYRKSVTPKIRNVESLLIKDTINVMGWDITNSGFEVIFSKNIPKLVESVWKQHINQFLAKQKLTLNNIDFYMAHPGGTKVLQAMERVLNEKSEAFHYSYRVLKDHGNMSSATIFYVIKEWMLADIQAGVISVVSALGPGFSSELLSVEWL